MYPMKNLGAVNDSYEEEDDDDDLAYAFKEEVKNDPAHFEFEAADLNP